MYTRLIWKRARRLEADNPHVLVCTLRLSASRRLALFQIKLRLPTFRLLTVYL
ncbi:MAG: hypothetical protein PG979_000275 [Rickettsia asembonensis]|nr:MAG: hypothetical protein PG979_000275 [Rickettsia asembonensis]